MTTCVLRFGSDALETADRHHSVASAIAAYRDAATELARYGQEIEATIHLTPSRGFPDEYPDYLLTLGPRGGLWVERC